MLFPSSPARGASSPGDGGGVFVPPELESMLQTTSPKTAKHVLSRAACDALAEVRRRRRVASREFFRSFLRSFLSISLVVDPTPPRSLTPHPSPPRAQLNDRLNDARSMHARAEERACLFQLERDRAVADLETSELKWSELHDAVVREIQARS
tara:strand:+ start:163 stop:621 length:459 start_codon:yes stop_codon:yes gene_type:complete